MRNCRHIKDNVCGITCGDLPATFRRPSGESREAAPALIELAWSSTAALAIAPLQDILNLGSEARMNLPGHAEGNWRWRSTEDMLTPEAFRWLHDLTQTSNRAS